MVTIYLGYMSPLITFVTKNKQLELKCFILPGIVTTYL